MLARTVLTRLSLVAMATGLAIGACDALYVIGIKGAWRTKRWENELRVNATYNYWDPELGYARKPRLAWSGQASEDTHFVHYRTDERGFRNPMGVAKADVVFIGDSYTEGAEVRETDTFVQQVGQATGLRVLNLGLSGYGPQQELTVLRRHGLLSEPRVVVWQICEGNDLVDARRYEEWRRDPDHNPVSRWQRYVNASLALRPFTRMFQRPTPRQQLRRTNGETVSLTVRGRYLPEQPAQLPEALESTQRTIETAYRLCRERNIRMVVIFVPIMARVMKPYLTFTGERDLERHLPGGKTDTDSDFDSHMASFCERIGCRFINLAEPLREAAAQNNHGIFLLNDEHFDRRGHRVVADSLARWLRSQKDVPIPDQQVRRSLAELAPDAN